MTRPGRGEAGILWSSPRATSRAPHGAGKLLALLGSSQRLREAAALGQEVPAASGKLPPPPGSSRRCREIPRAGSPSTAPAWLLWQASIRRAAPCGRPPWSRTLRPDQGCSDAKKFAAALLEARIQGRNPSVLVRAVPTKTWCGTDHLQAIVAIPPSWIRAVPTAAASRRPASSIQSRNPSVLIRAVPTKIVEALDSRPFIGSISTTPRRSAFLAPHFAFLTPPRAPAN